jgi:hypothetical protein
MAQAGNVNNVDSNLGPKVAAQTHPIYDLMKPTWVQLADVREGTGGFLDGTYLVAHPREWLDHSTTQTDETGAKVTRVNPNPKKPSPKLKARRKLARYENVASAILESKKAILFREQPSRRVGPETPKPGQPPSKLEQWWTNVDSEGTDIDDAVCGWWDLAATFGHVVLYFDRAPQLEPAETAADQANPIVRVYTPLDVLDWWRDDDGDLAWIKLLEATTTQPTIESRSVTTYRVRIVDETGWKLYDYKSGKYVSQGDHGMGKLPIVYLFGKRRAILPDVGESILGDPRNYIDLFNLTSEIRELLRNQTFSFINLPLGSGGDAMTVDQAQAMMGSQTGTMNVLFSAQPANILTGDPANVQSYHDEIARVKREIYRDTGVQFDVDSKDAEAQGALELKREEMTVRIAAYADECQEAEYALVDLWYRAQFGPDRGPKRMAEDDVQIQYPERFSRTPFADVLAQAQSATALGYPTEFLKELRKALVTKFEGMADLPRAVIEKINAAIESAQPDLTPDQRLQMKVKGMTQAASQPGATGANDPLATDRSAA